MQENYSSIVLNNALTREKSFQTFKMLNNTRIALNRRISRALSRAKINLARGNRCSYSTVTSWVDNDIKKVQNRKPRRVLFNVPGSDERKIAKGT